MLLTFYQKGALDGCFPGQLGQMDFSDWVGRPSCWAQVLQGAVMELEALSKVPAFAL